MESAALVFCGCSFFPGGEGNSGSNGVCLPSLFVQKHTSLAVTCGRKEKDMGKDQTIQREWNGNGTTSESTNETATGMTTRTATGTATGPASGHIFVV